MDHQLYFIFSLYYEWDQCIQRGFIQALAKEIYPNRVVVLNRPGDLLVSLFYKKLSRIDRLLSSLPGKNVTILSENLFLVRPFLFINPNVASRIPGVNKLQCLWLRWCLTKMGLAPTPTERAVIWLYTCLDWPFARLFPAKRVVYQPVDEYTVGLNGQKNKHGVNMEREMVKECSLGLTLSTEMANQKSMTYGNFHWLGQGVDFDLFSKAANYRGELPSDLKQVPGPRIGLVGNIRDMIDYKLIEVVLERRPHWAIIFIGPKDKSGAVQLEALLKYPNFHWLGPKPFANLPQWLAGLDVGIVPYLQRERTRFTTPGKLYEYWAAGLPTVTTNIGEYEPIADCLWVAHNPEEFISSIEEALRSTSDHYKRKRVAIAQEHSWENIARRALTYLKIN